MQVKAKSRVITFIFLPVLITILYSSISFGGIETVKVGKYPKDVAVNSVTSKAVITNEKDSSVSIVDLKIPSVLATITVGKRPVAVDINEQTNQAVVANKKDNTVSIINLVDFTVIATVNVGKDPVSVAINEVTEKAYVTNRKDDTISVIDLNTKTVTASIETGRDPSSIVIFPSANKGIVAAEKDGNIQIYNLATNNLISSIAVGKNPAALALYEASGSVLVANEKDNSVSIIDIAAGDVTATIPVTKDPKGIAVNPDTNRALVTSSKEDCVAIIDLSTNTVIGKIGNSSEPYGTAINRTTNAAVVSNPNEGSISIIDLNNTPYSAAAPTGKKPYSLDINPETNMAVVANEKSDSVSIIDIGSSTVLSTIAVDKMPVAVAVNPITNRALVANRNSDTITVIDIPTGTVLATVQTGRDPVAIAVNTITNIALVGNRKDNNVSVIDLNTNTAVSSITVGENPHGIAIDSDLNRAVVANKKDDTVSIVDLVSENILFTVDVGTNPVDVKVNSSTHTAVVTNKKDDTVTIIDVGTGTILSTLPVGRDPDGIAINARTNQALIANRHDKSISIIDLSTLSIADIVYIGSEVNKVAVNRANNTAVATSQDNNDVIIIHLSGQDVVSPQVIITSHQDGQTVASSPITISGTVNDSQALIYAGELRAVIINNDFTIQGIELVPGANHVIISADDIAGNLSTVELTIMLGANPPVPDVGSLPVITGECSATVYGVPTATDANGNQVAGTTTDSLNFTTQGTHTVTWTYDDGNGNAFSQTQTIIVNDTTSPFPDLSPLPEVEGQGSVTVSTAPTATDNCNGPVTGATSDSLTYASAGDFIINWVYDDGNGNVSTQQQRARVLNSSPLVFNDSYNIDEDGTLNAPVASGVIANDTDPDGDTLEACLTSSTRNGTLSLNADGSFSYIPNLNFNGTDSFVYTATDGTLQSAAATVSITVNPVNDIPIANAGKDQTAFTGDTVQLDGSGSSDSDNGILMYVWSIASAPAGSTSTLSNPNRDNPTIVPDIAGIYIIELVVNDGQINSLPDSMIITAEQSAPQLPPDAASVAPPVDQTVATTIYDSTAFLYTGSNPIQTGVVPLDIEPQRTAVLRGKVLDRNNAPLEGVTLTILDHPEFGRTLSRLDGMFDMAVNGGGQLTVVYEKESYLSVQRQITVPWQDYTLLPDVVMIQLDAKVTPIDLTLGVMQAAQGSIQTDADGTRQATILFPSGTGAEMVMPDASTQPITTINVRATEFTVGDNGPNAMPAELPPTSVYTYAVELSIDQALAAGADSVTFSQPVYFYVENFLGFPTGIKVPVGYYDPKSSAWIPSDDGLVIEILSITGGLADLDVDGSGIAADSQALAKLGITSEERMELASLYGIGQSLWRAPVTHFTSYDLNYGVLADIGAEDPQCPDAQQDQKVKDPCEEYGSVIECENQVLGEVIDVTGTSYTLNYRSDRVAGRTASNQLDITLSLDTIPAVLKRIELEIHVAGKVEKETFPAAPNQSYVYTHDGQDIYSRTLQGSQRAVVRIGYVYDGYYALPPNVVRSFGYPSGARIPGDIPSRTEVILWQTQDTHIGEWDARSAGLGGWTLSEHHTYDPALKAIYLGNGGRRSFVKNNLIIDTASGTGNFSFNGNGISATNANIGYPNYINVGPDGSLYIADFDNNSIRKVGTDGIITTVAGSGPAGYSGDGGPATQARLNHPQSVAIGPDGSLYITDWGNYRIRKVNPDGIITTVAGTGLYGYSGDNAPATSATFMYLSDITVGPDGSFYVADMNSNRVRKVDPTGTISTVAGNGNSGYSGDGGPANSASINGPRGLAIGPDGSLYIAQDGWSVVRRVDSSGIITTVAGNGATGYNGDGILATSARLNGPRDVAIGPDGSLYIADCENNRVRKVNPEGFISTIAGSGVRGFSGDSGPATKGSFYCPSGTAVAPKGTIYISDVYNYRVREVKSEFPSFNDNDIGIASENGSQLYRFDSRGRHLSTVDTLTGAVLYQFNYDGDGQLSSIVDVDGDVTTIQRDANGDPTAIIAQDGQQTSIMLDANGYISNITNPANESTEFIYTVDGLLTSVTDPKHNTSTKTYDAEGRLTNDANPAGGFWQFSRTDYTDGYTVNKESALGRLTTYDVAYLSNENRQRVVTNPAGLASGTLLETNGRTTVTSPDGTIAVTEEGPDPRFGMQAPLSTLLSITTPGGLSFSQTANRTVTLADENDLLSLLTRTDKVNINGRTSTGVYNAPGRTYTSTSPGGRRRTTILDALGRVIQYQIAGLEPIDYSYDTRGRLDGISTGTSPDDRVFTFTYNAEGFLDSIADPLLRTTSYLNDPVGRTIRQTLPDLREINYSYDANGNITSLTPPGRPAHTFDYTAVNLTSSYDPPDIGIVPDTTSYSFSLDKELTQVLRPDADTVGFTYNTAGQLTTMTNPGGAYTYTYDPATGRHTTITDPDGGTLTYTYDGALLVDETWSGNVTGTVTRGYNNNFWVTSLSVNGNAIAFSYDSDGLLTGAGSLTLSRSAQNGLLTGTTLGNVTTSLSHNGFGEVDRESASYSATSLFDSSFVYDKLGRIIEMTETVDSVTSAYAYGYDLAGRLETVSENSTVISTYAYDDNGNRLSLTTSVGTVNGVYDGQDRLTSYNGAAYTYTANGELETKTVGVDTTVYDYDELGNLISVTLPDGTFVEYIIDGRNRRVAKLVNSVYIEGYLYQGQLNPAAKIDDTGNILERYVYADKGNVPAYMIKGANTYRIISDHLGSPRLVVDIYTGSIAQRMDYDEFGNVILDTNPEFQPFGFAGGIYDKQTKLVRFGVRDYDSETGRWTAKDPIGFSGGDTNLYGYVINDPVNWIDPWGLDKTLLVNTDGGRSVWNGPTNGNWGGGCWSGGQYSCGGRGPGNAPPTDSGDQCYQRHDNCYITCRTNQNCINACDQQLVNELQNLPDDPRRWPNPPRTGTEGDSRRYRDWAIRYFR